MNQAVEQLKFEKAAELRNKIERLKSISLKQKVVSDDFEDRDVFAIAFELKILLVLFLTFVMETNR